MRYGESHLGICHNCCLLASMQITHELKQVQGSRYLCYWEAKAFQGETGGNEDNVCFLPLEDVHGPTLPAARQQSQLLCLSYI